MNISHDTNQGLGRRIKLVLLGWFSMIGFDFFLHAGVLAPLYEKESTFLLPPERAFAMIPVGYMAFLGLAVMQFWLMTEAGIRGWRTGSIFGVKVGFLSWGSLMLGLYSISTASPEILIGWLLGQTVELGIAGGVMGYGRDAENLKKISLWVFLFILAALILGILWQNVVSVS